MYRPRPFITQQNSCYWAFVTLYKHPNKIGSAGVYVHTHTHTHTQTHTHTHTNTHTHTHTHTHQLNVGEEEAGIGNICQYHLQFPVMHLLHLHAQEAHHYMPITSGIYRTYPTPWFTLGMLLAVLSINPVGSQTCLLTVHMKGK